MRLLLPIDLDSVSGKEVIDPLRRSQAPAAYACEQLARSDGTHDTRLPKNNLAGLVSLPGRNTGLVKRPLHPAEVAVTWICALLSAARTGASRDRESATASSSRPAP